MKLIIDIPKRIYDVIQIRNDMRSELHEAVRNCITLEEVLKDIKAEIETDMSWVCFDDWGNEITEWTEIKRIIDKHISGKEQT